MPLNGPAVCCTQGRSHLVVVRFLLLRCEQWSAFYVGIMICIGALITVTVLKGTQLSAHAFVDTLGRAFFWF